MKKGIYGQILTILGKFWYVILSSVLVFGLSGYFLISSFGKDTHKTSSSFVNDAVISRQSMFTAIKKAILDDNNLQNIVESLSTELVLHDDGSLVTQQDLINILRFPDFDGNNISVNYELTISTLEKELGPKAIDAVMKCSLSSIKQNISYFPRITISGNNPAFFTEKYPIEKHLSLICAAGFVFGTTLSITLGVLLNEKERKKFLFAPEGMINQL
jgi:hypothetical protein